MQIPPPQAVIAWKRLPKPKPLSRVELGLFMLAQQPERKGDFALSPLRALKNAR
jgi:hypothetical protein